MTIIVKKNYSSSLFKIIKEKLNNLELVSLPTETVYGLAGLGTKIGNVLKQGAFPQEFPASFSAESADQLIESICLFHVLR